MFKPYILMLALFMIYSIWSYEYFKTEEGKIAEKKMKENYDWTNYNDEYYFVIVQNEIVKVLLILLSVYFLKREIAQVKSEGISYFYSPWNYLDVATSLAHYPHFGFLLLYHLP